MESVKRVVSAAAVVVVMVVSAAAAAVAVVRKVVKMFPKFPTLLTEKSMYRRCCKFRNVSPRYLSGKGNLKFFRQI